MNPAFRVLGSFSGMHAEYNSMTCIGYASGWKKEGENHPYEAKINALMEHEL